MTARIFAYITHKSGVPDDTATELLAAARQIDPASFPTALLTGCGKDLESACSGLAACYREVWRISDPALAHPNAELVRQALVKVLPPSSIVLIAHDHFGIDLAPGLSIKLNYTYAPDVLSIGEMANRSLKLMRQEFGGQFNAHVDCDLTSGAVISVRPGAFKTLADTYGKGTVVDKSADIGPLVARRRYVETIPAEAGEVDITKHAILISIGRGIQEKENVAMAQELADAMGAAVSCSRPVVDAKWLEPSRQVGSSGKTVKPKIYLACGISGAAQHLAGIKGNPLIIAINKNPKAPIFQVADVGIVDDVLEFLPKLTNKVRELHSISTK